MVALSSRDRDCALFDINATLGYHLSYVEDSTQHSPPISRSSFQSFIAAFPLLILKMQFLPTATVIATFILLATCVPFKRDSIGVSSDQLGLLELFAQYSAAAYCYSNCHDTSGTKEVTCASENGICPLVEAAQIQILTPFSKYVDTLRLIADMLTLFPPKAKVLVRLPAMSPSTILTK